MSEQKVCVVCSKPLKLPAGSDPRYVGDTSFVSECGHVIRTKQQSEVPTLNYVGESRPNPGNPKDLCCSICGALLVCLSCGNYRDERIAKLEIEVASLRQQRSQLTLLASSQEWTLAPDGMTAEQHAAAGGAFFDREGAVHLIGEREPDGEYWLWVVPNVFRQVVDAEVARESAHQAK